MNVRHPFEILSAYLDGEVTTAERLDVARHLEACGECRALLEDFRTMAQAAAQERPAPVPSDMAARIVSALGPERRRPRRFFSSWSPLPLAVAASLLVVVTATWVVVQRRGGPEPLIVSQVAPDEKRAPETSPAPKATEARPLEPTTGDDRPRLPRRAPAPPPESESDKGGSAAVSPPPAAAPALSEQNIVGALRPLGYVAAGEEAAQDAVGTTPQKTRAETDAAAPAEGAPFVARRQTRAAMPEGLGRSIEFELSGAKGRLTEAGLITLVTDQVACTVDLGASAAASGEARAIFRMASAAPAPHSAAPAGPAKEEASPVETAAPGTGERTAAKEKERLESLRLVRVVSPAARPIPAANVEGVEDRLRHLLDVTARDLIESRCGAPAARPPSGD